MISDPPSPCTGVCSLDPLSALCRGCARTISEITAWPTASAVQKQAILALVDRRRQSDRVRSK